ncbi:hypothetical protein SprV_0702253500 [Sparganum proliferum]
MTAMRVTSFRGHSHRKYAPRPLSLNAHASHFLYNISTEELSCPPELLDGLHGIYEEDDFYGIRNRCFCSIPTLNYRALGQDGEYVCQVTTQEGVDVEMPIRFHFPLGYPLERLLLPSESHCSTFGRELLTIFLAVKHFRHFLEGREFIVFTDQKLLTFALRSLSDKYNSREIAHLDYISRFSTNIRHIYGAKNEVADMRSRPSLSSLQLSHGIDLCAMAVEQQRVGCPGDESVSGLQLKYVTLTTGSGTILCDVSSPFYRPFVPARCVELYFELCMDSLTLRSEHLKSSSWEAYHPAANGMVERFHRQLKTALRAVENLGNWSDNLPLSRFDIGAALKSDLGYSAAE